MKNRIPVIIIILLSLIYFLGISINNQYIGDVLSPILILSSSVYIYYAFVMDENDKKMKLAGIFLTLSIFAWGILDSFWAIFSMFLSKDPEEYFVFIYGYSVTNILMLIAFVIFGYLEFKSFNKIQLILDVLIIAISAFVIIWVFVFNKDVNRAEKLLHDNISMISIFADIIIYTIVNIWFFSVAYKKSNFYVHLVEAGGIIFAVSDLIYFYQYFYNDYIPNSFLDGAYMLSFLLMGAAAYVKIYNVSPDRYLFTEKLSIKRIKKEFIFLVVPVVLFVFKFEETYYLIVSLVSISVYYIFTNYIQNSEFKDALLKKEKEYVYELEQRVEDRTKEIIKIMNTDVITGLYSRRFFEEHLFKACENIEKHEKIILLYIDQNKYKSVRSVYGKFTAECLLREVGKRMNSIVVEEKGILCSYGADVFVAILDGDLSYQHGIELANKIIYNCSDVYRIESHDIRVTYNIGIAAYPIDAKTPEELIKNADTAMMEARTMGFNRIYQYNEELGSLQNKRNKIEMRLKKINFDEEFRLNYQPQVMAEDGSLFGFEALIRWYTKSGKFIPPTDFIPITEEMGLIIPLGYWIMENAAKQLCSWQKESNKNLKMAVNVSVKQLSDRDFLKNLRRILYKYNINPDDFEIEITENVQMENNQNLLDTLNKIKDMGISIAIDDFGTGYSSLYYLKNLPVTRIKIAKELVDNIENDIYSKSIIQMVISIAKTKEIKVIAEGVETYEQWQCLKSLDCDEIQGYYFSRPLIPEDVSEKWLNNKKEIEYEEFFEGI